MDNANDDPPTPLPATPRMGSGTYLKFRDTALEALRALSENRDELSGRRTTVAATLIEQLETFADEFGTYEPDAGKRAERVKRFYEVQEQVTVYLAGER